jgi:uncharacterized membrane protein YkvA (DUF1232 family)
MAGTAELAAAPRLEFYEPILECSIANTTDRVACVPQFITPRTAPSQNTRPACSAKRLGWARSLKRDVHAIYLAARDPRTPWYAKALALCVAGYALSPIDLIPDFVPVLGYLDEMVILPLGILAVVRLIPPEIMAENRAAAALCAERPISRTAGIAIVLVWAASIALAGWVVYRYYLD